MKLFRNKSFIIPAFIASAVVVSLFVTYNKWEPLERKAYDLRFQLVEKSDTGRSMSTGSAVIVGIEEKSVTHEKPIIFLYPDIGAFLKKMGNYNARIVGIDMIPVHRLGEKLKNAIAFLPDAKAGKNYRDCMEDVGEALDKSLLEPVISVSENIPIVQAFHGGLRPFFYGVAPLIKNLFMADAVLTDGSRKGADGIIRKQALKSGGNDVFAHSIYKLLRGSAYGQNDVLLNYSLAKSIPFYCFNDVMNDRIGKGAFNGKTVILGYVSGYDDIHPTPLGKSVRFSCSEAQAVERCFTGNNNIVGPVIQGVILETLLTGTSLTEAGCSVNALCLLLLSGTALIISMRMRPSLAIVSVFAIAAVFFAANLIAFSKGYVVHIVPQLISPFIIITFIYPYRYFIEDRDRRKIYRMFNYYVDREVLESLLHKDPASLLKGETRDVCILFLDIRDFTKLSLKEDPEHIVRFLNFYFGRITEIIQNREGFMNKFIGDGILAFFATGENPTANAITASQEIIKETKRLNGEGAFMDFIGDWTLGIGIGIHYGSVIMGNIGSERKMDFTIIGQHVNITSRIEGLTKKLGCSLLVSGDAYMMVKDDFKFRFLGEHELKGVDKLTPVYTIEEVKQGD